ncbi:MAG: proton-conducting transporter membrane subunit [Flavobacteriales bacterium]
MQEFLQLFILIPLISFLIVATLPRKKERLISTVALATLALHFAGMLVFSIGWLCNELPLLDIRHITLFQNAHLDIFVDLYFDKTTMVFSGMGSLIALMVGVFSKYYMHREEGFKRYFCTMLIFFAAYNIVVFAGNFETLFVGWEIIGITSFLLIAFYRDRYLPVKNGIKVLSLYRLGDICLILAMWMSHQLWHENIVFMQLNDALAVQTHHDEHQWYSFFICLVIVIAAMTKSAQLPFSSWLPRAMEGPTTSSAVFYGSLSVHIGVFLLLRTYPYWEHEPWIKFAVITIGTATALLANSMARVQPTVKTQIAYASITQIGLMFVEVALGWHTIALIHFSGNALLRTYQLLISPSVLSYKIHNMYFYFTPKEASGGSAFSKVRNSLYMLSVKEFHLDTLHYRLLWNPFKRIGKQLAFVSKNWMRLVLAIALGAAMVAYFKPGLLADSVVSFFPIMLSAIAFVLILRAFTQRGDALRSWWSVFAALFFIAFSIALSNPDFERSYLLIYLSGALVAIAVGYLCLSKIKSIDNDIHLNRYHSYVQERKWVAFVFLLSCLIIAGLPISPTFIGIDLLFSHIGKNDLPLIVLTSLNIVFIELALLRIYARIFLGQSKKLDKPIAFRAS